MSKLETALVGLFVGIACPLLTFVAFWWSAACVHLRDPDFTLRMVIVAALSGLGLGLLLDLFFLRQWVRRFYVATMWLMIALYLGLGIIAVAFFMGLPVGTIILGIAASVYMGRRERHAQSDRINATATLRKTALITASVTAMAALPMGMLALDKQDILAVLESIPGLHQVTLREPAHFALVGLLCLLLFIMQYWFSKKAGLLAFNIGNGKASHDVSTRSEEA